MLSRANSSMEIPRGAITSKMAARIMGMSDGAMFVFPRWLKQSTNTRISAPWKKMLFFGLWYTMLTVIPGAEGKPRSRTRQRRRIRSAKSAMPKRREKTSSKVCIYEVPLSS